MRFAGKPRYKWREVNAWFAEGSIDGYGACGFTTTID